MNHLEFIISNFISIYIKVKITDFYHGNRLNRSEKKRFPHPVIPDCYPCLNAVIMVNFFNHLPGIGRPILAILISASSNFLRIHQRQPHQHPTFPAIPYF
jgi:hypothetical protein